MQTIKLKYLFFIGFILMFLPCFVIYIVPGTSATFPICSLYITFLLIALLFVKNDFIKKHLKAIFHIKFIKIYLLYLSFIFLTSITHFLLGSYKAYWHYYLIMIGNFLMSALAVFIFPSFAVALNIKFKHIIKLIYVLIYLVLLIGIIQYLSFVLNIKCLYNAIGMLSNIHLINLEALNSVIEERRAFSVFSEPSGFGQFLFITLPFVLNIVTTKYKLFNNVLLNNIFKKSIIIIMLLDIVFTKSPIYLVFCVLGIFGLLLFKYKNWIKKYFLVILIIISIAFCIILQVSVIEPTLIQETYLFRIVKVILSLGHFDNLVLLEPSLATRLISYHVQIRIFLDNMFCGVGFYNTIAVAGKYFMNSSLPLTVELARGMFATNKNMWGANPSIVYTQLAEIGIIGFILYCYWQVKMFKVLHFLCKRFCGIEQCFIYSLFQSLILIYVISFYNLYFNFVTVFVFFGIILMVVLYYKNKVLKTNSRK